MLLRNKLEVAALDAGQKRQRRWPISRGARRDPDEQEHVILLFRRKRQHPRSELNLSLARGMDRRDLSVYTNPCIRATT